MTPSTAPKGRTPPPTRGVRFYDADRGAWRYRPRSGPVVDLHSPEGERAYHSDHGRGPGGFDARTELRRTGFRARDTGRETAQLGQSVWSGFYDASGAGRFGVGAFLITAGASLLGLALLDTALRGRGPDAVQKILAAASSAITGLFAAADPIVAAQAPAKPADGTAASAGALPGTSTGGIDPAKAPGIEAGPRGFNRVKLDPRLTQGGRTIFVDQTIDKTAAWIVQHFGVKVSSGYRDPAHNAEVGGAPRSDHLTGGAIDFVGSQSAMQTLQAWAERQGFPYVEPAAQAKDHVHISFFRTTGRG